MYKMYISPDGRLCRIYLYMRPSCRTLSKALAICKKMAAVDFFALKFSSKNSTTLNKKLMLCRVFGSEAELLWLRMLLS